MTYGIYPNSTPEFRMSKKEDGTTAMQVRYINRPMGYVGKWMDVNTEEENDFVTAAGSVGGCGDSSELLDLEDLGG
jgi:hypothetical protein